MRIDKAVQFIESCEFRGWKMLDITVRILVCMFLVQSPLCGPNLVIYMIFGVYIDLFLEEDCDIWIWYVPVCKNYSGSQE